MSGKKTSFGNHVTTATEPSTSGGNRHQVHRHQPANTSKTEPSEHPSSRTVPPVTSAWPPRSSTRACSPQEVDARQEAENLPAHQGVRGSTRHQELKNLCESFRVRIGHKPSRGTQKPCPLAFRMRRDSPQGVGEKGRKRQRSKAGRRPVAMLRTRPTPLLSLLSVFHAFSRLCGRLTSASR